MQSRIIYSLLFLLLFQANAALYAQVNLEKVKFSRIEVAAGLSNSNVTCTIQDSRGYLWIGTVDGLNKYDGYSFKIYRNIDGDSASLLKNIVNDIFEDSQGILWVCTRGGGVHYYDRSHDKFMRIGEFSNDCNITTITEDRAKNLWIGGARLGHAFVARLDHITNRWNHYNLFKADMYVSSIIQKSKNEFWICVPKIGFFHWDVQQNTLHHYTHSANANSIVSNDVVKAVKDTNNENIWIATRDGLSKFEIKRRHFTNFVSEEGKSSSLPVNTIGDLFLDGNQLWLATENGGLSRLKINSGQFTNYQFNKNDPTSLSDNSVWSVYVDKQKRIWVGTFSKGLCVIDKMKEKFTELDIPLKNDIVNTILKDQKNRIWIGTEGGVTMKDDVGIHYFQHQKNQSTGLSSNPVLSIFEDSKRNIWLGTWGGGVNKYDDQKNNFIHYNYNPKNPQGLSNANIYSITEERITKSLVIASYHGLNVLSDVNSPKFEHVIDNENKSNNYLRTVFIDSKGNTWTGSISELNFYDFITKQRSRVYLNKGGKQQDTFVNSIQEDKKGRIWIGTNTALALLIDKKYVTSYTTKDGLPNDIIRGILEDAKGNLWLGTASGLSKFNPNSKKFINYDVDDGLLSNEFKPNSCFKTSDGQLMFGGKGVIVFHPDSVKENQFLPPVYIDDFQLNNESVKINEKNNILTKHISEVKEISIPPLYSFFTLNFVALNFTSTNKTQYAYKLDGFHSNWNYVGNQRSATFTNLDPGTYTFHVKASNNDGVWNEKGATLIIHIIPEWWKTWWAKLAASLLLLGAAIAYYHARVFTIKEQKRKLEAMVSARTKELQQKNNDLILREERIQAQNEELLLREEEIQSQNEELYSQREELTAANETLLKQREELAVRNEELTQSEEEISAQRDLVSEQNQQLQIAGEIIEKQNSDIVLRNESLEADVIERTKELVEYNQQLEQFAFISAHNLRAPVARILGLGQIFEYAKDPSEEKVILQKLVLTTKELDRVVKDLNTVLEIRKDSTAVITEINLEEELKLIRINLEKEIQETQTHIIQDFSEINIIHTVKPYLDSILVNLVSNAIKYRHPNRFPVIHIKSEIVDDYVCLIVQDNGLGLDLKTYGEKLFVLYSRFHSHVEGKGMGLYLVKTQVATLGGKIEVQSEIDNGVTFKIFLKLRASKFS